MSYFGTVAHMIHSLKYNNSLLRRPKAFSKLKEYINRQTEYRIKIEPKQVTPSELKKIREKIKNKLRLERRKNNLILVLTATLILLLIALLINSLFLTPTYKLDNTNRLIDEKMIKEQKEAQEKFEYYINDGYKWLSKNHFHNALFQFDLAVKTRPDNYEANLGLAKTLLKKCSLTQDDCNRANKQLNVVLQKFPDNFEIKQIISSYLLTIGDTVKATEIINKMASNNTYKQ